MSSQIRAIVDLLNAPPFSKNLSLVSFDEKQPHELILLLNEIMGQIDASQKVDMTREDPTMAQNRIIMFLHAIAYRPQDPSTFATRLFNGDREVIYALLKWLLENLAAHQKRAYLAPFLTEIEVPPDLMVDEMVMEIKNSCTQLKEEFIHSHKQLAVLEEATQDPQAKKEMIKNLDDERRQLMDRVNKLEKKLQGGMANFDEMLVACKRLKREQEDEKALKKRFKEQQDSLAQARRAKKQAEMRLEKIRSEDSHLLHGDAVAMLDKLQTDVAKKQKQARDDAPRELAALRLKLEDMGSIMHGGSFSEMDIQELQTKKRRLEQEVERLRHDRDHPPASDDKITMFRQQASMVERKKEQLQVCAQWPDSHRTADCLSPGHQMAGVVSTWNALASCTSLPPCRLPPTADLCTCCFGGGGGVVRGGGAAQTKLDEQREKKKALEQELEEKEGSFEAMGGEMGQQMHPDEFRRMKQEFRAKSTQHKRLQKEMSELRAETGVLQRTLQILESQCKDREGWMRQQEQQAGVEGASRSLEELERVSAQKAQFDQRKGLSIEEHAREVEKVRLTIKEKKQKLAPMIKELRAARGKFQQLDTEYNAQKDIYDQRKLSYETGFMETEKKIEDCKADIRVNESAFHHRNCKAIIDASMRARAEEEVRAKTGSGEVAVGPNQEYRTYGQMFEERARMTHENVKQLRRQKAEVEQNFEMHSKQLTMFSSLQMILQSKLTINRSGGMFGESDMAGGANQVVLDAKGQAANVFTLS